MPPAAKKYKFNGRLQTIRDISIALDVTENALRHRLKRGMAPADAFVSNDLRMCKSPRDAAAPRLGRIVSGSHGDFRIVDLWHHAIRYGIARCGTTGQRVESSAICIVCDHPCIVNNVGQ